MPPATDCDGGTVAAIFHSIFRKTAWPRRLYGRFSRAREQASGQFFLLEASFYSSFCFYLTY